MAEEKKKEIKVYIYPDIHERAIQSAEFKKYGLTYAVNAELARSYGLPPPPTPNSRKSKGGRSKSGKDKNHHVIHLPSNWFELLEGLETGENGETAETWQQKDYPHLARYAVKFGLVRFVQNFGARPTEKLRDILVKEDARKELEDLYRREAERKGYELKFESQR